jgi:hypothetical protein
MDTTTQLSSSPALPLRLRRAFLVTAPLVGGLLTILGASADPAVGESGRPLWEAYAANPDPLQWKSVGFHYAYAFWGVAAFALAWTIRARGAWLATAALLAAFVGMTTLPGLLVVDFYDSAIGQVAGVDTTERVDGALQGMWGIKAIAVPGLVGFLLALPLATLAAWRAGAVRWWAPAAAVAGIAAFIGSGVAVWGTVLTALLFGVVSLALARSRTLEL